AVLALAPAGPQAAQIYSRQICEPTTTTPHRGSSGGLYTHFPHPKNRKKPKNKINNLANLQRMFQGTLNLYIFASKQQILYTETKK
ncbi:MAG: hypothetical protein RIM68_08485, partial [Arenibacter sp.]